MVAGKNAMIFGRREDAPWHPLGAIEGDLSALLQPEFEVSVTDRGERLLALGLSDVDLLVGVDDRWTEPLDRRRLDAVEHWVRSGGALLLVHSGICWARDQRWRRLVGGKFIGHGPARTLAYHRISDGARFELFEEPYRFSMPWFSPLKMVAEYEEDGRRWPALWCRRLGRGSVGYAQPGHSIESLRSAEYRRWLKELAIELTSTR